MTCPNCGASNPQGTRFCSACGAPMEKPAQQPTPTAYAPEPRQNPLREPLTTGQFFLMDLVAAIPLVGFIMCLVWAFSDSSNQNRKSWARAKLVWIVVGVVLGILFFLLIAGLIAAVANEMGMYY